MVSSAFSSTRPPKLGLRGVILLLCYINLLNYVDRGVIPGAPESFQAFMTATLGINVTEQSAYLGLLSSAFIAATALFSLIFGYLALRHKPFTLIAWGMSSWILAVLLCGLAHYVDSYYLLLFGRVLSGVGEASFHCNAMPFINRHAPKENSALWLGVFIVSITVGMAAGYVYGSIFASSSLTWAWAFFVEAALMVPPVLCCVFCIPDELNQVPTEEEDTSDMSAALKEELIDSRDSHLRHSVSSSSSNNNKSVRSTSQVKTTDQVAHASIINEIPSPTEPTYHQSAFFTQWWHVFRNVAFSLVAFGHAAYTFSLAAFSVFSPILLIGMGFFEAETEVSLVFGVVIIVSGTIGTVLGGITLDRMTQSNTVSRAERCRLAVDLMFYLMVVTTASGLIMMLFTSSKFWFLAWLGITFLFMSAVGPAETVAVMELFPQSHQAMAVAANTVVILVFGDVPSPVVLGWLKDTWAPLCGTVEIVVGDPQLNPDCHLNRSGLNGVLLFAVLWLLWAVLLWGSAKFVVRKKAPEGEEKKNTVLVTESPMPSPAYAPRYVCPELKKQRRQ